MSAPTAEVAALQGQLESAGRRREALRRDWDAARNPELMRFAVHAIPRMLQAERCGLFVCSADRKRAWLVAGSGVEEKQIEVALPGSMVGQAVQSETMVLCHRSPEAERRLTGTEQQTDFAVVSALTLPLRRVDGSGVIGAVQVLNRRGDESFGPEHVETLRDLAFLLQPSMERIFDEQRLLEEAEALDAQISQLDALESSLRADNLMRTFEPSLTDIDGQWVHHRWQGKRYPPFIHPEATAALCEAWDTGPQDVFIATHQKVGTQGDRI